MFALDVFSEGYSFGETMLALLSHLIPTAIVIIGLTIAWRWEGVGAMLFIAAGLFYLASSKGEGWIIFGPLFLVGLLFLRSWINRTPLQQL